MRSAKIALLLVVGALVFMLVQPASAGVRLGGISLGVAYSHTTAPYYPFYPYGYAYPFGYGPLWDWGYPPLWGPAFYPAQGSGPMGSVQLRADDKNAGVYIDGAYAGTLDKLKNIHLSPGAYDFELRSVGGQKASQRVYVLSGKTVKLDLRRTSQ